MCGFAGFLGMPLQTGRDAEGILRGMGETLVHRGPDDQAVWWDPSSGFGVAHRRLSVYDLSEAGRQPMVSHDGRYVLAFNGEIYNHLDLRRRLVSESAERVWRGHSDTEVLLACLADWGIVHTLESVVGMFAFALWDTRERTLCLARDRMGEKPLYWGWQGQTLLFGSELKAMRAYPSFRREIDRGALTLLLRYNYIPSPHSIYRGISKLAPGHYVLVRSGDQAAAPTMYWDHRRIIESGLAAPFTGNEEQAMNELEALLASSIRGQMIADVPLGAFLSGGIDSSVIAALMQQQSARPIHTYAIGFEDQALDEAVHARAVARHLGTTHSELYITEQDALSIVPDLPRIYCEPFADSSQIPMCLLSRMARRHVTVALSGDGGDELFGGYNPYRFTPDIWRMLRRVPYPLRRRVAMLTTLPLPQRAEKLLSVIGARDPRQLYGQIRSHWTEPESVVLGAREPDSPLRGVGGWPFFEPFETWMMSLDAHDYMPDDILVKVDRAAMANSLETRIPMLDHRVVEFAARLPLPMKIRDGTGKWLLRQMLYRHVPQPLVDRPKAGFMVPLGAWLKGPLRAWAEDLLQEDRLRHEGYFDDKKVLAVWREHLSGRVDRSSKLWSILMFQAWLSHQ